jgi:hypothetical protein
LALRGTYPPTRTHAFIYLFIYFWRRQLTKTNHLGYGSEHVKAAQGLMRSTTAPALSYQKGKSTDGQRRVFVDADRLADPPLNWRSIVSNELATPPEPELRNELLPSNSDLHLDRSGRLSCLESLSLVSIAATANLLHHRRRADRRRHLA